MPKSLKIHISSLFLLLTLNLFGQIQYSVTPTNTNQVTQAIINDFPHLISISPIQIGNHINALIDPTSYCANCPNADITIQENAPNALQINWNPVVNADFYEIQYLNLGDGISNSFSTSSTSLSLNNIPYGAYAFSIVTYSTMGTEQKSSKVDIIIEETPIILGPGIENCSCPMGFNETFNYLTGSQIIWFPVPDKRYKFDFTFLDGTHIKVILTSMEAPEEMDYPVMFFLDCHTKTEFSGGNTLRALDAEPDDPILHFFYDEDEGDYNVKINSEGSPLIAIDLNSCEELSGPDKGGNHRLSAPAELAVATIAYPNPAQEKIWIEGPINKESPALVSIYDSIGRLILQISMQSNKEFIDISNWPTGQYNIRVESRSSIDTHRIIKID